MRHHVPCHHVPFTLPSACYFCLKEWKFESREEGYEEWHLVCKNGWSSDLCECMAVCEECCRLSSKVCQLSVYVRRPCGVPFSFWLSSYDLLVSCCFQTNQGGTFRWCCVVFSVASSEVDARDEGFIIIISGLPRWSVAVSSSTKPAVTPKPLLGPKRALRHGEPCDVCCLTTRYIVVG